jgi:hypothetical protein
MAAAVGLPRKGRTTLQNRLYLSNRDLGLLTMPGVARIVLSSMHVLTIFSPRNL